MNNGDYIRNMDNERLSNFLFIWGIDTLTAFMKSGGQGVMDPIQLKEWLESNDFSCEQTIVGEDFTINDDFTTKKEL